MVNRIQKIEFNIQQYPSVAHPTVEVMVECQPRNIGGGVWQGGLSIRLVTNGDGGREHVESTLMEALNHLEAIGG